MAQSALSIREYIPALEEILEQQHLAASSGRLEDVLENSAMISNASKSYVSGVGSLVGGLKSRGASNREIEYISDQILDEEQSAKLDLLPIIDKLEANAVDFANNAKKYKKSGAASFAKMAYRVSAICKNDANSYRVMLEALRDARLSLEHYMSFREDVSHKVTDVSSDEDFDSFFAKILPK